MAGRIHTISKHLSEEQTSFGINQTSAKSDDDVVIVSAVRTALTRGRKGGFKDTVPDDLLAAVLAGVTDKVKLDKKLVDDIQVGNVLPPMGGAALARMSMFYAGFDEKTSLATLNRQCSSGLQAVANIVGAIKSGFIDIGIGAGVESMTAYYYANPDFKLSEKMGDFESAADCLIPMGITSENVAKKYGITRETQDKFAVASHMKAAKAQKEGLFTEIIPVETKFVDKDGEEKTIVVERDDGIRAKTTLEGLAKLRPAFTEDGTTTAGNASQVSDGAAAVLLMKRSKAKELGLPVLARFRSYATIGVPPNIMGIGPAYAIPKALDQAGLSKNDIDVFEINEAFASQAVWCCQHLGIDMNKVNPQGGAIAIGHPLGCTGARQISTIIPELKRANKKYGVVSMCIGTGMGAAAVIENE